MSVFGHQDGALDWENLRVLLAVAEAGSILEASRRLGCSHSTVVRRLDTLEASLDARLLIRHRKGCDLTSAGEEALASLRLANQAIQALQHKVSGHRQALVGTLRIAVVDAGAPLLIPLLQELRVLHPGIRFDVLEADAFVDLSSGEADLAVRLTLEPPADLVGRCHGSVASAPYVHRSLVDAAPMPWLALHPSMGPLPQVRWEARTLVPEQVWLRMSSGSTLQGAVRAGLGAGVMPCIVGDPDPDLVRIGPPEPDLELQLWTLYPRDLRRAARLRTVLAYLTEAFARIRPVLQGEVEDAQLARDCLQPSPLGRRGPDKLRGRRQVGPKLATPEGL